VHFELVEHFREILKGRNTKYFSPIFLRLFI
jgi:hypothetical protein